MIFVAQEKGKTMDDLISRQAAIDALRKMQTYKLFSGDDMLLIDQAGAQTELMLLPPAQPGRIKSKWALHTYMPHNKFCLACRNDSPYNKQWDFCPNCGADMRGEQDDKCRQV